MWVGCNPSCGCELEFQKAGNVMLVRGTTGSTDVGRSVTLDVGIGMLGHSIILRRDDNVVGLGNYRLAMMPPPSPGIAGPIIATLEDFPRRLRKAMVPTTVVAADGWAAGVPYQDDHMELFADFDHLTGMDLQLGLDSNDNGFIIANNKVLRESLPGYAGVAANATTSSRINGVIGLRTFPPRKRLPPDELGPARANVQRVRVADADSSTRSGDTHTASNDAERE
jgi:hypothetical protein